LISTSGIVVSKHYCGGVLFDVSLNLSLDSCCDDTCDSCGNENLVFQVDDDFSIVETIEYFLISNLDIIKDMRRIYYIVFNDVFGREYNIAEPPPDKVNILLSKYQLYLC